MFLSPCKHVQRLFGCFVFFNVWGSVLHDLSCPQCILGLVLCRTREERDMWPLQRSKSLPWLREYGAYMGTVAAHIVLSSAEEDNNLSRPRSGLNVNNPASDQVVQWVKKKKKNWGGSYRSKVIIISLSTLQTVQHLSHPPSRVIQLPDFRTLWFPLGFKYYHDSVWFLLYIFIILHVKCFAHYFVNVSHSLFPTAALVAVSNYLMQFLTVLLFYFLPLNLWWSSRPVGGSNDAPNNELYWLLGKWCWCQRVLSQTCRVLFPFSTPCSTTLPHLWGTE